jgi:hypothetical protein
MSARIALCLVVLGMGACQREPAIVIRFEPSDLAGRDLAKPRDLGVPPDGAVKAVAEKKTATKSETPAQCASDADCVIIPDGCCDCANGGKEHAVAKRDEAKLRAAQRASCKDVMCTMMMSTDPTCGKRPVCVDSACTMRNVRSDDVKRRLPPPK